MQCPADLSRVCGEAAKAGRFKGAQLNPSSDWLNFFRNRLFCIRTFLEGSLMIKEGHQCCFLNICVSGWFYGWCFFFFSDCPDLVILPLSQSRLPCTPEWTGRPCAALPLTCCPTAGPWVSSGRWGLRKQSLSVDAFPLFKIRSLH